MKNLLISTSIIAALATAHPALASDSEIETLRAQMQQMQQQLEMMQNKLDAQEDKLATQKTKTTKVEKMAAAKAEKSGSNYKISFKPSPKIESTDGQFSFQPFGRAHLDYTAFNDDIKDHPSNGNFRRARLGFKGKFAKDFNYKFEMDFAKEAVNFKEISLTYGGFETADLKLGHFKPSLGLEENTSSNYIQFMERSNASNAFARDEEIGAAVLSGGDNWSFALGGFTGDAGNTSTNDDEAYSFDARGSFAPIAEKGKTLHVGIGASYRAGADTTSFKAKESGIGDSLVSTGTITGVDNTVVLGAELAGVYNSFSAQAEYFRADVSRDASTDAGFDGYAVQAGYLLTGESRPYSAKSGTFKRVKPNEPFSLSQGGIGAWEILARYENLDLNDSGAGILGGELDATTVGLNWYLNNNSRVMFNFIDVDTDSNAVVGNDSPQIYSARAAWDF
ncbi:MAG: porin [Rickettsiales bacterium]|nr:porin [Rickettsiales bacterium]